jgi:hypothetical protein
MVVAAAAASFCYGAATLARHRAAAAADAAALVVALHAVDGSGGACGLGGGLARLDGAMLTRCELAGAIATVAVSVRLPPPLAGFGTAVAAARAGPASEAAPAPSAAPGSAAPCPPPPRAGQSQQSEMTAVNRRSAASFSSGSLPVPHFGECTHDGQPVGQRHAAMASRVAVSQSSARW